MPSLLIAGVFALVALPVAVLLSARRGRLVDVEIAGGRLTVRPRGLHRVWAVSRGVDVPVGAVAGIRVADAWAVPRGVRFPGTHFPGSLVAGTFGLGADRAFWLVRKGRRALVVDLDGERCARLVVEVENPDAVERRIRAVLPHLPGPAAAAPAETPLLRPLPPDLRH